MHSRRHNLKLWSNAVSNLNSVSPVKGKSHEQIRCNREKPRCNKCIDFDIECSYPERVKRKPRPRKIESQLDPIVSSVLDRLRDVEQTCAQLHQKPLQADSASPSEPLGTSLSSRSISKPRHNGYDTGTPASQSSPRDWWLPRGQKPCDPASPLPHTPSTVIGVGDSFQCMRSAVLQIRKNASSSHSALSILFQDVEPPRDLAKHWTKHYVNETPFILYANLFPGDVVAHLPDVLHLPHIHVDPVMVVIYYCVLYNGACLEFLHATEEDALAMIKRPRSLYQCALRAMPAWRREATGTASDFIAAIMLSIAATDNFDQELSWQLHKLACEYAQKLRLHEIDRGDRSPPIGLNVPDLEESRASFWKLVQLDYLFRLIHDKPRTITADAGSWTVDLPGLRADTDHDTDGFRSTYYIVQSRITFAVAEFFHNFEDSAEIGDDELLSKTEAICRQIEDLYDEWRVVQWLDESELDSAKLYIMSEVAVFGHLSIIFMLRRVKAKIKKVDQLELVDAEVARLPLAQKASREAVKIVQRLASPLFHIILISIFFDSLQMDVAYQYLARSLMASTELFETENDVLLFNNMAEYLATFAQDEMEVRPLASAITKLRDDIQQHRREVSLLRGR